MPLLLASSSAIRRAMLDAAGVAHLAIPADIDEGTAKSRLSDPAILALALASAKAEAISVQHRDDWTIGSDSVVGVDGRLFDKPASREAAAEHLRFFSGKAISLFSAVALARRGSTEWSHCESATLHVRPLSENFIANYLTSEWPAVAYCVGVFRLEGPGVQLFDRIDGNHFTILGLPLLPLLGALRERGILAS